VSVIAYHGTGAAFSDFKESEVRPGLFGWGFYFAEDAKEAGQYAEGGARFVVGTSSYSGRDAIKAFHLKYFAYHKGSIPLVFGWDGESVKDYGSKGDSNVLPLWVAFNSSGELQKTDAYSAALLTGSCVPRSVGDRYLEGLRGTSWFEDALDEKGFRRLSQKDFIAFFLWRGDNPLMQLDFSGNVYKARLDVSSDNLLVWDREVYNMSEPVRKIVTDSMAELGYEFDLQDLGAIVYKLIDTALGGESGLGQERASKFLLSKGVKGVYVKSYGYYVIFSSKDIKVLNYEDIHDPQFEKGTLFGSTRIQSATDLFGNEVTEEVPKKKRRTLADKAGESSVPVQRQEAVPVDEVELVVEPQKVARPAGSRKSAPNQHLNDTFEGIQKQYKETSQEVVGNPWTVTLPDDTEVEGVWKLVDAYSITPSHQGDDMLHFDEVKGFPTNEKGENLNTRDYKNNENYQEAVRRVANKYNARALLDLNSPIVVSQDGVVISGNNRTMSSRIAAKNGTDGKYIEALKKSASIFGFSPSEVDEFEHPRVILEVPISSYTAQEFDRWNKSSLKEESKIDTMAKFSKLENKQEIMDGLADIVENVNQPLNTALDLISVAGKIEELFVTSGVIGQNEIGRYFKDENSSSGGRQVRLTEGGKDLVRNIILGSLFDRETLDNLMNNEYKKITDELLKAAVYLVRGSTYGDYSIIPDLQRAVGWLIDFYKHAAKGTRASAEDFKVAASQQGMDFGDYNIDNDVVAQRIAWAIHSGKLLSFLQEVAPKLAKQAQNDRDEKLSASMFGGGEATPEEKRRAVEKILGLRKVDGSKDLSFFDDMTYDEWEKAQAKSKANSSVKGVRYGSWFRFSA
jgi:hypothetical protein